MTQDTKGKKSVTIVYMGMNDAGNLRRMTKTLTGKVVGYNMAQFVEAPSKLGVRMEPYVEKSVSIYADQETFVVTHDHFESVHVSP